MHKLLSHHIVTHVLVPIAISTALALAISQHDTQGSHPLNIKITKAHAPTRKGE